MEKARQYIIEHTRMLCKGIIVIISILYFGAIFCDLRVSCLISLLESLFAHDFLKGMYQQISNAGDIHSMSAVLTMEAVCSAIIIFLYGRFSEKTYGLPVKDFIEYTMGKNFLVFRVIIILSPFIQIMCIFNEWFCASFANVLSSCLVISVFIFLSFFIMQKDEALCLIKKMVMDERKKLVEKYNLIIKEEIAGGFLEKRSEIQRKNKYQIEEELESGKLQYIINCTDRQVAIEVIDVIYNTIKDEEKYSLVDFIYMFDLTSYLLSIIDDNNQKWKITFLDRMFMELNKRTCEFKDLNFSILYMGVIYAIIFSKNENVNNYLWNEFFESGFEKNENLRKQLLIAIAMFVELNLEYDEMDNKYLLRILKLLDSIVYQHPTFSDITKINEYSFILSIKRFGPLDSIRACFEQTEQDLLNILDNNYIPFTTIGILLRREVLKK